MRIPLRDDKGYLEPYLASKIRGQEIDVDDQDFEVDEQVESELNVLGYTECASSDDNASKPGQELLEDLQESDSNEVATAGTRTRKRDMKDKKLGSGSKDDSNSYLNDDTPKAPQKPVTKSDTSKLDPANGARPPKSTASNDQTSEDVKPPKCSPPNKTKSADIASPPTAPASGDSKSLDVKNRAAAPAAPVLPPPPEVTPPAVPPPANLPAAEAPFLPHSSSSPIPTPTPPLPTAPTLPSSITFNLVSQTPPPAYSPAHTPPSPPSSTPTKPFTNLLPWNPSCTKATHTSSPIPGPKKSDVPKLVTETKGCWETVVPEKGNDNAGVTMETNVGDKPDKWSAAWGKIHDLRIRWTVYVFWGVVILQVVFGAWEFGTGAWGWREVDVVPRWGWWVDEGVREAAARELPVARICK